LRLNILTHTHGWHRGAEEKFPIFTYLVLKADIPNLFSELQYVSDFIRQQSFGLSQQQSGGEAGGGCIEAEAKYRLAELEAAVNYLLTLNWSTRDAAGVLVPRAWVEQRLRGAVGDHIHDPKWRILARLIVDILVEIGDLPADAREVVVDDRPTVELMHQHAQWTTDLLATMGLDIDLPLPHEASPANNANANNSDIDAEAEIKPGVTASVPVAGSGMMRAGAPSLTVTLRVRHQPDTYLRFAELLTRAS
jgi:hypothetical protein